MRGHLVTLEPPAGGDFELMARWMRPTTPAGALATGEQEVHTGEELEQVVRSGRNHYLVVHTHGGDKIGLVSWQPMKYSGSYAIGAVIGDGELWDAGCGAEATALLLDYLFHTMNAHRVQYITGVFNKRTIGFLAKGQLVIEGILRDYFFLDGEYHDAVIGSLLRDEYYALKQYGAPQDMVPADDKAAARRMLQEYLAKHWNDLFATLVERR